MSEKEAIPDNSPNPQTQYQEPTPEERTVVYQTSVSPKEKEYLDAFARIMAKLILPNGVNVIKENSESELIRTCLSFTTNYYMANVFIDSRLIAKLPDKDTKKDFMAFRAKYMNFPIEKQFVELRSLGLVPNKEG